MKLSKKAKQRLGTLIRFMRRLPKDANKHFDMESWFSYGGEHELKAKEVTRKVLTYCGASACALGWACTIPSFQKAGLRMPINKIEEPWSKSEEFFDVPISVVFYLFMMDAETPKQWASKAEQYLRDYERAGLRSVHVENVHGDNQATRRSGRR